MNTLGKTSLLDKCSSCLQTHGWQLKTLKTKRKRTRTRRKVSWLNKIHLGMCTIPRNEDLSDN